MNTNQQEEQQWIADQMRILAQSHFNHDMIARDKSAHFSRANWEALASSGLFSMMVPRELGGLEQSPKEVMYALEMLGRESTDNGLNFAAAAHILACMAPIIQFGNPEQQEKFLPKLMDGSWIAANGMTETESGSDAFNMKSRAEKEGENYIIKATKCFVSNGPYADIALIYVNTDAEKGFFGGISAFILESQSGQFRTGQIYDKMGLRTCGISEILVDHALIPSSQLLGKEGSGAQIFSRSMDYERTILAGIHLGMMRRVIDRCARYARERQSGGSSIIKHQAISHALADMETTLAAARALSYEAASLLPKQKKFNSEAAMVKLFVSNSVKFVMDHALQIFGGYGFMTDYELERDHRDAQAATLYSGTSAVMKNIIASNMTI